MFYSERNINEFTNSQSFTLLRRVWLAEGRCSWANLMMVQPGASIFYNNRRFKKYASYFSVTCLKKGNQLSSVNLSVCLLSVHFIYRNIAHLGVLVLCTLLSNSQSGITESV